MNRPLSVRWATSEDSPRILAFQKEAHLGRRTRLFLDRSPDLEASYRTEGEETSLLVAETGPSSALCACAALSWRLGCLSGQRGVRLGYLGSLIASQEASTIMREGFKLIRKEVDSTMLLFTSILSSNVSSRRLLTSGKMSSGACYFSIGAYRTVLLQAQKVLKCFGRGRSAILKGEASCNFVDAKSASLDSFFESAGILWNGHTHLEVSTLCSCYPGLSSRDTLLVHDGNRIRAVGALWSVQRLKRWTVHYSPLLAACFNAYSTLSGRPSLHCLESKLVMVAARLLAPDSPDVFKELIYKLAEKACILHGPSATLCLGFHQSDPYFSALDRIPSHRIDSELFHVTFGSEPSTRSPHPWYFEVGAL